MTIQAIIFDFGNVIGFFDHRRITRRLAQETSLPEETWQELLLNAELTEEYESGRITTEQLLNRIRQLAGIEVADSLLCEAISDIFWSNPEVCNLVFQLKGRYRLLVGSNTCDLHARQFRSQFADTLRHFDALVLSHEIGSRKPKRAFFEHCRKMAQCDAGDCVFIDDLHRNVEGARACGMNGILYRSFDELHDELTQLGVELPVRS
jgi:putative hydrolase of the HAD superfamily